MFLGTRLVVYTPVYTSYAEFASSHFHLLYCLTVELELGLLDEAAEKFEKVIDNENVPTRFNAAYGLGSCMVVFARQATESGKHGEHYPALNGELMLY